MKTALPLTFAAIILSTSTAIAEPVTLDAVPQRISMFKNGLAMVTSRAVIPGGGAYRVPAPEARYGSLWISWEPGVTLDQIIVTEVERGEEAEATNMSELLRANVGRTFSIRMHDEDAWVTGILTLMPTRPQPTPRPYGEPGMHGYNPMTIAPPVSDLLIFKTDEGTLALQPSRVAQIRFDDSEVNTTLDNMVTDAVLGFTAEEADGEGDSVVLRYLAQGIAWSPSYVVEMIDDETARLACKAVIVNDLMDLNGVDIELIAGYPNLKFSMSPTAMGPTPLADLLANLQQAGQPIPYGVMGNAIDTQQRMNHNADFGLTGAYIPEFPDLPIGERSEDLYFYQVPDVKLAKSERGYFPLISVMVPGTHVYTCDIRDFVGNSDYYTTRDEDTNQIVWHSLQLINTTDQPWTTAPGMTIKDGRVIGQDVLEFTPPGGTCRMKITQAVSLDVQQSEIEIARVRKAEKFNGRDYDKITIEGTLSVTNYKDVPVTIYITKLVSGEVESTDTNPKIVKIASNPSRANSRSRLTWEVVTQPGNKNTLNITYRYSYFAR